MKIIQEIERGKSKSDVARELGLASSTVATIWKNRESIAESWRNRDMMQSELDVESAKKIIASVARPVSPALPPSSVASSISANHDSGQDHLLEVRCRLESTRQTLAIQSFCPPPTPQRLTRCFIYRAKPAKRFCFVECSIPILKLRDQSSTPYCRPFINYHFSQPKLSVKNDVINPQVQNKRNVTNVHSRVCKILLCFSYYKRRIFLSPKNVWTMK